MNFIIDTDMGIDDAVALLMVLGHPQASITAITTVRGNISLSQATLNAGVVLDTAAAPPLPIFAGCARSLLGHEPDFASEIHGPDGLGGAGRPHTSRPPAGEHASLAMVRLARQSDQPLTLLTLGPLTNVALALHLDPDFFKHLDRLVIMGGAIDARGNTTPPTEFNIGADPEAAQVVFSACRDVPGGAWLVSWETSVAEAIPFETWDRLVQGDTPQAGFVRQMGNHLKQAMAAFNLPVLIWPDPLAAAVALEPDIVTAEEHRFVEVETGHGPARGQTIVDYRPLSDNIPNLHLVRGVDKPAFTRLLGLAAGGR